jgi:hypothetical protein
MKQKLLCYPVAAIFLNFLSGQVMADVISDWNLLTVKATKIAGQNTNLATRTEAIEAIAVYDAVNSIKNFGSPYHFYSPPKGAASATAAVAQAAHDVLLSYFPVQKQALDSALTVSLSQANDGPVAPGQAVGAASAAAVIALRANDGSLPNVPYPGPAKPGPGQYRPTPAGFLPGINQQWANIKPFVIRSGNQFRPAPPPALNSATYQKALTLLQDIGAAKSNTRTEEQTHIAQFYKQDAELTVNEAARLLAALHPKPVAETAYIFLLADLAEADARIAIWDAKYTYLFWRPVTALNTDTDGGVTNNYAKFTPLVSTPPHPDYPCGHCGTVTAGFEILKKFYGDNNSLTLHTSTPGEPARTIKSLSEGELENGWSRIYGGIHYPFDNDVAQKLGRQIAAFVLANGPKIK